jgi:NADPH:quinone reductase-like Zn-dependent oxidoreductase
LRALTLTATGSFEHLQVMDLPAPEVGAPDEVRVRIHSVALNRLDLWVATGIPGVSYRFPHIVGSDAAGVVDQCGAEARRVRPGDRVLINPGISCGVCQWCRVGEQPLCAEYHILGEHIPGAAAEYVVVPERNLAAVPEGMSWGQAAGFTLATLTAWRMLMTRARLAAGETVLIWGIGGGVALAALKIARLVGARAIVTSSSDRKLAHARELGAEVTLNHSTQDVVREIRALTGKRGVEVVVDSVGEATWDRSLRCLARLGRLVTCGGTSGHQLQLDVRRLFWYQWTILGSTMGSDAEFRQVTARAAEGELWPEVDTVFPLARGREAYDRLGRGEQLGKVVIEVGV